MKKYKSPTKNGGTTIILDSVADAIKLGEAYAAKLVEAYAKQPQDRKVDVNFLQRDEHDPMEGHCAKTKKHAGTKITYGALLVSAQNRQRRFSNCEADIVKGDPETKEAISQMTEQLHDMALDLAPSLKANHAGFQRSEDGFSASPELLAAGEERCCIQRKDEGDAVKSGEGGGAYRLIINTDVSCPLLPVTDFECVAYAEDEDHLTCVTDFHNQAGQRLFTKGKRYELSTNSYAFTEHFTREKPHYNEEAGLMYTATHKCQLSGTDRYIAIQDDQGKLHRFMERPQSEPNDHDESALWRIFERPVVKTVAESHPEAVRKNALILSTCELLADFAYYPGQLDYLSRLGVKDYGVVAADTGCGKSLMALSLIQMKAPNRALIIAPQGTMRSSSRDEDDDNETDYQASQWLEELRRYAPGLAVFQLFSMDDYHRILNANHGRLPSGVYITYYQAVFSNGARETTAASWDDERLQKEIQHLTGNSEFTLGEPDKTSLDPNRYWCHQIGEERSGIRCILTPCMATQIGHHFDFVALDEGHLCCNLGATVSQMLIRLQPKYRFVLSATPITNVVSNLFSLMGWVCVKDWFKGSQRNAAWPYARDEIARFTETFQSVERDFTQEQMNDAENKKKKTRFKSGKCIKTSPIISAPARLLKILKPNMAYISKPMVRPDYQGPKILDVRVPMGRQQTELYVHFMNRGNITNPNGSPCNALVRARKQITYLRNICADPAGFDHGGPVVRSNFNPKTVAILELVRDIIAKGDPFVIVCARKGQTDTLHRALKEAGVLLSRIDSTVSAEQHSHQSNLFKAHKTQGLLLAMRCANSYSFSECPYMIIGSLEYSWGSLAQARGRVDRVNSKRPATIYCVLHKHSLEETIFDVVGTKSDAASICLQGRRVPRNFKPLDLSEVLAMSITGFKSESVGESDCEAQWPKLRQSIADSLGSLITAAS